MPWTFKVMEPSSIYAVIISERTALIYHTRSSAPKSDSDSILITEKTLRYLMSYVRREGYEVKDII